MQIVSDLLSENVWLRKVGRVFEAFVLQPEDVEIRFVPFGDLFCPRPSAANDVWSSAPM